MAVTVIRYGDKRRVMCGYCGNLLEYEKGDAVPVQTGMNEWERELECPNCREKVRVKGQVDDMTQKEFFSLVKGTVRDYVNEHLDRTDDKRIGSDDVYVVWYCKTLQNWKALASTTLPDGMYYELTVNGDKSELYLDAYKKFENRCIPM